MDPRHGGKISVMENKKWIEVDLLSTVRFLHPPLTYHHVSEVHALHLWSFHDPCAIRLDLDRYSHAFQLTLFLTYFLTWQPNFRAA